MNITDLLTQIQTYLKPHVDVLVEFFPERPSDYRLNHPKGSILIGYDGTTFDASNDISLVRQQATVHFSLTVMFRQLNGKQGALVELDKLRQLMIGFKPNHYRSCILVKDHFVGEDKGVWQYVLNLKTQSLLVQTLPDEPTITKITLEETP